jgi:hypothetical protein
MSRTACALLACVAIAGSLCATGAQARPTPQQQLDKLLAGRTAGKPVECISLLDSHDTEVIDRTAIVYGRGRTIYVNVPNNASSLNHDDVMVTKIRGSSQLCKLDTVQLHDRSSHFYRGFVGLNQFVPYTRTD